MAKKVVKQAGETVRDYGSPDVAKTLINPSSSNSKLLGEHNPKKIKAATTSRTVSTCPSACPFRVDFEHPETGEQKQSSVCYAHTASNPGGQNPFSRAEAKGTTDTHQALDNIAKLAKPNTVMRHLESGDVDDDYMEAANALHAKRPDMRGWGYTHDWRNPKRTPDEAKGWTLNASTEGPEEAHEAIKQGWQAVIESPHDAPLHGTRIGGRKVVTCPAQTTDGRVGCATCNLCSNNTPTRPIVEFLAHGATGQVGRAIGAARDVPNLTEGPHHMSEQIRRVMVHDQTPEGQAYAKGRRMATGIDPEKFTPAPTGQRGVDLGMPRIRPQ